MEIRCSNPLGCNASHLLHVDLSQQHNVHNATNRNTITSSPLNVRAIDDCIILSVRASILALKRLVRNERRISAQMAPPPPISFSLLQPFVFITTTYSSIQYARTYIRTYIRLRLYDSSYDCASKPTTLGHAYFPAFIFNNVNYPNLYAHGSRHHPISI